MNLTFTFANYFYSKFYCGRLAASVDGATNKDKGCSLSDGAMFCSVEAGRRSLPTQPPLHPQAE